MFDTQKFIEKLHALEALRPGDTVKYDTVDRIKPEFCGVVAGCRTSVPAQRPRGNRHPPTLRTSGRSRQPVPEWA